ncbi:myosin regulatory light chain 2, smooth muscle minor isoform-like [Gouania willdenowi]|uniref:Myosin regulatory light chain 2, smooth muscle minor isoform-like n=1 Tax=Gouania willdenowi TaxID=441366 RepID=A0A8C5I6C5_GOUWI|nr:myosin regulatory light chain 2, smooth muscle minor isoform-like [Gouania willdenowi]
MEHSRKIGSTCCAVIGPSLAGADKTLKAPLDHQTVNASSGPFETNINSKRDILKSCTHQTVIMSSKRAKGKNTKKRPQRATSNVFAMFNQSQIQEFKEAFNMIDQNRDGFIDKEDLHDMLASLGKNPTEEYLDAMMNEAPGPINFTMFLTMFGEKLNGTDPEDVIRNAFACFDEEATGMIQEEYLRELLTTMGDRFNDEEVDELFREAPIDKKGNFNYVAFTRILKHGAKDKDD